MEREGGRQRLKIFSNKSGGLKECWNNKADTNGKNTIRVTYMSTRNPNELSKCICQPLSVTKNISDLLHLTVWISSALGSYTDDNRDRGRDMLVANNVIKVFYIL